MDGSKRAIVEKAWQKAAAVQTSGSAAGRPCVVCVFARGAMDGLSLVVPYREANYYSSRPNVAIPAPAGAGTALDLDGQFGLHPGLAALKPIFDAGDLACVHAVGLAKADRSHFDAQRSVERGDAPATTGWLGRYLAATAQPTDSVFRAIAIAAAAPESLAGPAPVIALPQLGSYNFPPALLEMVKALYSGAGTLPETASTTMQALATLAEANPAAIKPENDAVYPQGGFGQAMLRAAQFIKSSLGVEAIGIDLGGWDTHAGQAATLDGLCPQLAEAMAAFHTDLGARMSQVTLVLMSEFGRTLKQNAALGTDHGWGGLMMLMGGGMNGGRVFAAWPGLERDALDGNGDLPATTDFRQVLHELVTKRLSSRSADSIFPGYRHAGDLGLF